MKKQEFLRKSILKYTKNYSFRLDRFCFFEEIQKQIITIKILEMFTKYLYLLYIMFSHERV